MRVVPLGLIALIALGACSNSSSRPSTSSPTEAGPGVTQGTTPSAQTTQNLDVPRTTALDCDPLDERACLLPWPNDAFTVPDGHSPTGRRLAIQPGSAPKNADGSPIDVTDENRGDGFSPGSAVLAYVEGVDLDRSGIAPSTDIGRSLAKGAPIVLLDTTTDTRVAYWAELDAQAPVGDRVLIVHPAASLREGHHFVVGLRNLKNASGTTIPRATAFQAAVEGTPEPPERAGDVRAILAALNADGVSTDELFMAWDFTVASAQSLSGRVLHMRDQTYATLADSAPKFAVSSRSESGGVRTVDGTYEVPNYLWTVGPGTRFQLGTDGLPTLDAANPVFAAKFHCLLPLTAPLARSGKPADRPTIVYGHGLLGDRTEVDALRFAPATGLAAACATDEIGMNADDVANLAGILGDLSRFPEQADRLQQGMLDQQLLGRLLNSPKGFASSPAFQSSAGAPLVAVGNTVFVGNSQGGILGGAASAISSEWQRVVLGVPGINYSLLLPRSVDWLEFQPILDKAYTDPVDRLLAVQLIQLLWDRGENDGYVQHLTTDPYPGITAKKVLLVEAFGDHQVANVSTEILARTIGAAVHRPSLGPGRSPDVEPQWNIQAFDGSTSAALVVWDYGTPPPPTVNLPPTEPGYGQDPHGAGSREPLLLQQALTFLVSGTVDDVCRAAPCVSRVLQ